MLVRSDNNTHLEVVCELRTEQAVLRQLFSGAVRLGATSKGVQVRLQVIVLESHTHTQSRMRANANRTHLK